MARKQPAGPRRPRRTERSAPKGAGGETAPDAEAPATATTIATVELDAGTEGEGAQPEVLPFASESDADGGGDEADRPDETTVAEGEGATVEAFTDGVVAETFGLAGPPGDDVVSAEELGEAIGDAAATALPDLPGPARTAPRSVSELHLKGILESPVFVSDKPLSVSDLAKIARAEARDVRRLLEELREEYRGRGVQLDEIAGGWQFRSSAVNAPFVRELLQAKPVRLTRAQVETLAIIAYRQPMTRPEVDEIRGVDSGSALKVLLERDLVRILGRKEDVGRPVLYGTTGHFLEFFGLKSLRELPTLREFTDLTPESEATLVRELGDAEGGEAGAHASAAPPDAGTAPAVEPTPGQPDTPALHETDTSHAVAPDIAEAPETSEAPGEPQIAAAHDATDDRVDSSIPDGLDTEQPGATREPADVTEAADVIDQPRDDAPQALDASALAEPERGAPTFEGPATDDALPDATPLSPPEPRLASVDRAPDAPTGDDAAAVDSPGPPADAPEPDANREE